MRRKACREKPLERWETSADKQTPTRTEVLLSACMWTIIFGAICYHCNPPCIRSIAKLIVGEISRDSDGPVLRKVVEATCTSEPLEVLQNPPPEFHRVVPNITLFAPCLYDTYRALAKKYLSSANRWRHVQTTTIKKIVVEHHEAAPRTWRGDFGDKIAMLGAISKLTMPAFRMTGNAHVYRYHNESPLVTLMPEPNLDGPAFDRTYGELLRQAHHKFGHRFELTYFLPGLHPAYSEWAKGSFGVTSFPSIVVYEEPAGVYEELPGRPFVYKGDMSKESVLLFLEDVLAGCINYRPQSAAASFEKTEDLVCDARPVLQDL